MQVAVIKNIVERYTAEELMQAEMDMLNEQPLQIEIEGKDEGEQLTHIMAAIWIQQDMKLNHTELRQSIRNFSVKVRTSID